MPIAAKPKRKRPDAEGQLIFRFNVEKETEIEALRAELFRLQDELREIGTISYDLVRRIELNLYLSRKVASAQPVPGFPL
ncbi:MAG: hypothetical protein H2172_16320 [Opitutus sp.]|nr:hypothetical protein [Opitutus sp.]MCS6248716.1 hypothetical protein [Opitutus sp.]MCS6275577.1 hypothetical protein [Opitutus sp.]MCS6299799.1 hypothetical protein [Opitutus sp.]